MSAVIESRRNTTDPEWRVTTENASAGDLAAVHEANARLGWIKYRVREVADVTAFVGQDVVIGTPRSMGDGALTVRWGKLVAARDGKAILDGFHDSAGIGAYVGGSYRHDGVEFPLTDITTIRRAR